MDYLGKNVAFIPVRGGSKSIPLKNIKPLLGKPLVLWVIEAALNANVYDKVVVSTDHLEIRKTVNSFDSNILVVNRSEKVSSDTASTESTLLEFAQQYDFENITLIQATSPLLTDKDLQGAHKKYQTEKIDSILSVVNQKRFIWEKTEKHYYHPTNYDPSHRPRRQEQTGYFVENGAFYITSRDRLLKTKTRISGNIGVYVMPEDTFYEIDEPSDWQIVEKLLRNRLNKKNNVSNIKALITDVDGVLTDSGMYYSSEGHTFTKFSTRDGAGFQLLKQNGIITGIISGEDTLMRRKRFEKLGIDIVELGVKNKLEALKEICEKNSLNLHEIAYIGDDFNDYDVIQHVGLSAAPCDAEQFILESVDIKLSNKGGKGAFREFANMILEGRKI